MTWTNSREGSCIVGVQSGAGLPMVTRYMGAAPFGETRSGTFLGNIWGGGSWQFFFWGGGGARNFFLGGGDFPQNRPPEILGAFFHVQIKEEM